MSKAFSDGTRADYAMLNQVMARYHHELVDAQSRVSLNFVKAFDKDDEPTPALKHAGHYCEAYVKLISRRRKLRDPHEAEIDIDGHMWEEKNDQQREALLDHELSHIKVVTDRHGIPKRDEDERVQLKLVPDDIFITGFLSVIRHYGQNAGEYQSISSAMQAAAAELAAMVVSQNGAETENAAAAEALATAA